LNAKEGSRAETWFKWWTERIGFEEAEMERRGEEPYELDPPDDEAWMDDVVLATSKGLANWGTEVQDNKSRDMKHHGQTVGFLSYA
jgi:hypothetical protein